MDAGQTLARWPISDMEMAGVHALWQVLATLTDDTQTPSAPTRKAVRVRSQSRSSSTPRNTLVAGMLLVILSLCASLLAAPQASAQSSLLNPTVKGDVLAWDPVTGASEYLIIGSDGREVLTSETEASVTDLADEDFLTATVFGLEGDTVVAAERVRSSTNRDNLGGDLTVGEGMSQLATIPVRITGQGVRFDMPRDVLQMIDSWSLYRDGQLVAEAHKGRNLKDTDVQPGEVYAYTIVLNAPDWVSSDEDRAWVDAPCVGDCDEGPASSEQDLVDDDKATDLIDDDPAMDDEQITADGISFTLPVSIPATGKMKAAIGNVSLAPQTAQLTETAGTSQPQEGDRPIDGVVQNEDPAGSEPPEVELSSQNADSDVLSSFNDYRDDASVWHRTFIIDQYIKGPEPFVTWNYFGGDNRGFSNSLNASFRTEVKTITDFETDRVIAYRPSVSNTKRYTRRSNGTYVLNAEKTATLDPIVQSVNENGRVRFGLDTVHQIPFRATTRPSTTIGSTSWSAMEA